MTLTINGLPTPVFLKAPPGPIFMHEGKHNLANQPHTRTPCRIYDWAVRKLIRVVALAQRTSKRAWMHQGRVITVEMHSIIFVGSYPRKTC